jgi:hypothetical protein
MAIKVKAFDPSVPCIGLVAVAVGVIFVMAATSSFNAHPDEQVHFKAARYYMSSWLPPAVGAAKSGDTYDNHWGRSYLDEPDIVYFLAGKFSQTLKFTQFPPFLLTRAFNFALFVVLFLILLHYSFQLGIPLYGVLLLSPQLWYIFSYFNGDAFGLFVSILLALELSQFIKHPPNATPSIKIGLWLGMLILAKRNYYVLIPILIGVIVWHAIFYFKVGQRRVVAKAWLKVLLLAAVIALPQIGYQQWVNEFNLAERRAAHMEEAAASGFKPSQVTDPRSPWYVNMRAKGRPFQELLSVHQWHLISFKSMVGVYGWMDIFSPDWYYWVVFFLYSLSFARLFFPARPFEWSELTLAVIGILGMIAAGGVSFLNSWTVGFQAQGRYLFPVFCIILLLLAHKWERLPKKFYYSVFLSMGILSLWNFIFVGLENIPR